MPLTLFGGLQIEELFSSSFSLQAEDAAGHFSRAAAATGALAPEDAQAAALPSSSQAPFDWSLKTRVRFSSSEPFTVAEEAVWASGGQGQPSVMQPPPLLVMMGKRFDTHLANASQACTAFICL